MLPAGFEPAVSAGKQLQTYILDRATTGTEMCWHIHYKLLYSQKPFFILCFTEFTTTYLATEGCVSHTVFLDYLANIDGQVRPFYTVQVQGTLLFQFSTGQSLYIGISRK